MSNKEPKQLSEVVESVIDNRGRNPKSYTADGIPVIDNYLITSNGEVNLGEAKRFIDDETYNNFLRKHIAADDVLMTLVGNSYGKVATAPKSACAIIQNTIGLRCNKHNDNLFLYYLLRNNRDALMLLNRGAAQPSIKVGDVLNLEFHFPPLDEQVRIAGILGSLDRRIQKNSQINRTLEQIAQAIFRSWFVDFEPVKTKIAAKERWLAMQPANEPSSPTCHADELAHLPGLETYMNQAAMQAISGKDEAELTRMEAEHPEQYAELRATAELFPAAMQDSELGEIPKGWSISQIGDEVSVVGGGTPSTKNPEFWEDGEFNWTSPKDLSNLADKVLVETERKVTKAGLAKISSGLLPVNTVLMSSRAPVGYLALAKIPVAVNQGYIAMKCEQALSPEFVIQWCATHMDDIKSRASGTTFAEISKKNFKIIPVVMPAELLVSIYSKQASSLYQAIENKIRESDTLAKLRDSLLPKLLSGELSMSEAEDQIPETTATANV